jgi:hypothetical protein
MGRSEGIVFLTAEARRKTQEKLFIATLCNFAVPKFLMQRSKENAREKNLCDSMRLRGSMILTAESQRKCKRKNLCDSLRICGSMILTAEAQRKFKRKKPLRLFATLRFNDSNRRGAENTQSKKALSRNSQLSTHCNPILLPPSPTLRDN